MRIEIDLPALTEEQVWFASMLLILGYGDLSPDESAEAADSVVEAYKKRYRFHQPLDPQPEKPPDAPGNT